MPASRPLKFKSVKELHSRVPDGEVHIVDCKTVRNKTFKKEKDLAKYITENIKLFARDILGGIYLSHNTEVQFSKQTYFMPRERRVDLVVRCVNKLYIVEIKNPKGLSENRQAIGQLLDYGREFLDSKKELVLLTTMFDCHAAETIAHYKLPIRYIYFQKDKSLEYLRCASEC